MHRTVVYELAKYLAMKKNYEITILQPSRRHRFAKKTYSKFIHGDIETIYFPSFFPLNISYTVPLFHKEIEILCKLLSKLKCEIIQACDYEYLTSIAPIFAKRRYGIPIIITSDSLTGYSWFYGNTTIDAAAKLYTYSIGKWILNSYDRVVFLYRKASEEVKKFGVSPDKVFTIPNGVNLENFKSQSDVGKLRAELSIKQDERVLLFVGRLATVKRVEILIALTKSLLEEGFRVKTVIVGDGPRREYYETLSRSIKNNVIFIGHVPRNQVYKYYLIADVFVLPSFSEGLPTVLLEASVAGKPSVASNVNGVSDIIVHEETGYLVERSDINSYNRYVKLLLTDENLRKRMGKKAAEYVKENFNWDVITEKYEQVYQQVVNV